MSSREGFSARAIANYFIGQARQDGREVTHMKLQKLSYIAHGWCLALLECPLIQDSVQAWEYGPVYPSLYHELKEYGKDPIHEEILNLEIDESGEFKFSPASIDEESSDEEHKQKIVTLLKKVWEVYRKFSAIDLSAMTHEAGTPWGKVVAGYSQAKQKSIPIPNDLIRKHYKELARRDDG